MRFSCVRPGAILFCFDIVACGMLLDGARLDIGVAVSVIALYLEVAWRWRLPTASAMALAAFLAIFHGHANGAEIPSDAYELGNALGFRLATVLLHIIGIGIGPGIGSIGERSSRVALQISGSVMALAGVGILTGSF